MHMGNVIFNHKSARWFHDRLPFLICMSALATLLSVLLVHSYVTSRPLSARDTMLPILMGFLGAAVYLMHSIYSPGSGFFRGKKSDDPNPHWNVGRIFVRLFFGPIAGWLAYTLLRDHLKEEQLFIWLPFLAGFSSDLLVGVVSQIEKAIKSTLGIQSVERGLLEDRAAAE